MSAINLRCSCLYPGLGSQYSSPSTALGLIRVLPVKMHIDVSHELSTQLVVMKGVRNVSKTNLPLELKTDPASSKKEQGILG